MKEKDRQGAVGAGQETESRLGLCERRLQDGPSDRAGPSAQTSVHTGLGHPRHRAPISQPPLAEGSGHGKKKGRHGGTGTETTG